MGCECGSTKPARILPKPRRLAFTTWRTTKWDLTSSIFAHINHRQFVFFGCNTNKFAIKLCSIVCLNILNGFYSASQTRTCTKVKIKLTTKSWQKLRTDDFWLKENREMQWVDGSTFEVHIPAQTWSLNCQVSKTYERAPRTSKTSDVRRSTFITKRCCLNSLMSEVLRAYQLAKAQMFTIPRVLEKSPLACFQTNLQEATYNIVFNEERRLILCR